MNIEKIIRQFLIDNGYDGLCNPDSECGCSIEDDDLFGCAPDIRLDCQPAYKHTCNDECWEECDIDCNQDKESWCMKLSKDN
jgi:hypothetical protein